MKHTDCLRFPPDLATFTVSPMLCSDAVQVLGVLDPCVYALKFRSCQQLGQPRGTRCVTDK